ncbi:MAG: DUF1636 domain-containing protein [Pseudomonadota bacterium]
MDQTNPNTRSNGHRISVCVSCRHTGSACRPGFALIQKLQQAITDAGGLVGDDFEVSGVACMAGCERPCTVAYHASKKATYLFGDIDPDEDINDLLAFAEQYAALDDGWCSATTRPAGLRNKTLARVPSALINTHVDKDAVQ